MLRFLVLALISFASLPAMAQQNTLPAFSLPRGEAADIKRLPPPASVETIDQYEFFGENQYLRDLVKLQHQNSVLEQLLARQVEIERVADAYGNLGVEYRRPAPPIGICRQLPANLLCMSYYPNSYPEMMQGVQNQVRQRVEEIVTMLRDADEHTRQVLDHARNPQADEEEEVVEIVEKKREFRWSDISCLAGSCEAVIRDVDNVGFALTVQLGDVLPDGSQIVGISASGVDIMPKSDTEKAERVALSPLPVGGIEAVPTEENPFGIPGLVNLDDVSLPPGFDLQSLGLPNAPMGDAGAESPSAVTGAETEAQPLEVQSTEDEGAIVEAVDETAGIEEAQPVLPATGLTF